MLLRINERLLPLTGGQPSAGQIRSRRICRSLAAFLQHELFRVSRSPTIIMGNCPLSTAGRTRM
ncbi:hypothetical protein FML15_16940 [Klebsiella michiganensis]|nr:hypothetical protein [Klebsiella michiganensis]MBZ7221007.1 hypothetical protein [Klebsiella michiganensis]MBZ7421300.1 hypothetical protein [Klebsiella michiganensis]MBZ7578980.1 hypothetical protein [Klebsiella michiganensis]MBZ7608765.1 hypothetical protein [Klebsiella michiganensis]